MNPMVLRLVLLTALGAEVIFSQFPFSGLSSTVDGSAVYFGSSLRLQGAVQPVNGKVFVAGSEGVRLFRAREPAAVLDPYVPCSVGGFADYFGAQTSSGDALALYYRANGSSLCSYPINTLQTEIITRSGEITVPGGAALSAGGRYAIVYNAAAARPFSSGSISIIEIENGREFTVQYNERASPPGTGRPIADNGTAVLISSNGLSMTGGYLVQPGAERQPFPVMKAVPLAIDAAGMKVLYAGLTGGTPAGLDALYLLNLKTLDSTLLVPDNRWVSGGRISDDLNRLIFLRNGQVHLLDTSTIEERILTKEATPVTQAAISGNGEVVYAATRTGGLLKINTADGARIELIGRAPFFGLSPAGLIPGLTGTVGAFGFSDSTIEATPPLPDRLENIAIRIGERKAPMVTVTPEYVAFIVPWDIAGAGRVRVIAEVPGRNTPFAFPEIEVPLLEEKYPRAGAIARQNWQRTLFGPVNTGEIIHVYAIGLGPVSPEVPPGMPAPSAEPFARTTRPLTCSNAAVLYAGLAPGAVERVYQIDLRIGPTPGYQKFSCTLGNSEPFVFLTLSVVP